MLDASNLGDLAAEDWQWPEEGAQRSAYYAPNRVETQEPPAPKPEPKLLKRGSAAPAASNEAAAVGSAGGAAPAQRTVHISDYAWADDGLHVKVYLSVPCVRREAVQCEFRDDAVDFAAEGLPDGTRRVLALRRLYDHIHPPGCSCKVLESKGKVVLALAKPPRSTTFDAVKDWRTLTLACGAERIDVADPFASHQQKSFDGMMAGLPPLPAKSAARPH